MTESIWKTDRGVYLAGKVKYLTDKGAYLADKGIYLVGKEPIWRERNLQIDSFGCFFYKGIYLEKKPSLFGGKTSKYFFVDSPVFFPISPSLFGGKLSIDQI